MKLKKSADAFVAADAFFQRSLAIFRFIEAIVKNKEAKKALDSILSEANKELDCYQLSGEDNLMCEKLGLDCKFWWFYSNLDEIHTLMKRYKDTDDKKYLNKVKAVLSDDYAQEIFSLSMKVVAGCVWVKMGKKQFIAGESKKDGATWFDDKKSVLHVAGNKILITQRGQENNAHKILKHIFKDNKDNLNDDFFFSEIAEDVFEDLEYKEDKNSWHKYYDTCKKINERIFAGTKKAVENFLIFNSGKRAYLKINPKYL